MPVDELTHDPERANNSQAALLEKLEDTTASAVELHRLDFYRIIAV